MNIVGATEVEVTSGAELTALLEQAAQYRLTAATFKNDTSSRSHAVCRIRYRRVVARYRLTAATFKNDIVNKV